MLWLLISTASKKHTLWIWFSGKILILFQARWCAIFTLRQVLSLDALPFGPWQWSLTTVTTSLLRYVHKGFNNRAVDQKKVVLFKIFIQGLISKITSSIEWSSHRIRTELTNWTGSCYRMIVQKIINQTIHLSKKKKIENLCDKYKVLQRLSVW